MHTSVDLPAALSRQLLDAARAKRSEYDPVAWLRNRPTEHRPIDEAERILGLATLWAEAKVSFAYWEQVPDVNWDAAFLRHLPLVQAADDPVRYYDLLQAFASLLRDGHTRVLPPLWITARLLAPAVRLYPVEGLPVVVEGEALPRGSVITRVNDRPVDEVMAERLPVESVSTEHDRLARVCETLLAGPEAEVQVEARLPDGKLIMAPLERGESPKRSLVERVDLGQGRVLVRIRSWQFAEVVAEFNQAFPDFDGITALVIDLRQNRGGNSGNGDAVLARLVDRPARGTSAQFPMYCGTMRAWNYPQPVITLDAEPIEPDVERPRYSGPVAVLTSFLTYSAAENFCAAFRSSGRGPIVGEPTGGSTGQPVLVELPGGGIGVICAKRTFMADGGQIVGVGIQPDLLVAPTIAGVTAGRDEVLERALAVLGV